MNNIQGYALNKPSTKTTQAPGGNSSISFGDYQEPAQQQNQRGKRQVRDPNSSQFTIGGQQEPVKPQQQQQDVHTSVKVKNPPGGQSSIQFG
ncbi:hypothetical protein pb186bvf_013725 [Paramecium bursaria]